MFKIEFLGSFSRAEWIVQTTLFWAVSNSGILLSYNPRFTKLNIR